MARFDGKVIVVTGAARGLGRAAANLFSEQGASLALVDILGYEIGSLVGELGGDAKPFTADLSKVNQVREVVGQITSAFGRIDVLIKPSPTN